MELDAFLEAAWAAHGDQPQQVAEGLVAALPQVQRSEQLAAAAELAALAQPL